MSTLSGGLNMKTTLMRTISIALFIFRDASSRACARLSDRTLHGIHYGALDGLLIHYTHTYLIAFFFFLLFTATFNAALKQNGLHLTKRNHKVVHPADVFYPVLENSD